MGLFSGAATPLSHPRAKALAPYTGVDAAYKGLSVHAKVPLGLWIPIVARAMRGLESVGRRGLVSIAKGSASKFGQHVRPIPVGLGDRGGVERLGCPSLS